MGYTVKSVSLFWRAANLAQVELGKHLKGLHIEE